MAHWSPEDSLLLITLVDERGKKWVELASHFPDRNPTQLRNRHLRIVKGRERVEAGVARNLCRVCGEVRSSHICKGRNAAGTDDAAVAQRVRAACSAAGAAQSANKKAAKRPSRGRRANARGGTPQRAAWLPATTGTTREHEAIVEFIQGGA